MAATVKEVREFFGMNLKEMKAEWTGDAISREDKNDLLAGLGAFYELPEDQRAAVLERRTLTPENKSAGVLTY